MKFELRERSDGKFDVSLLEEVDNVFVLEMSPEQLEPALRDGEWLVVAFAVWDGRDYPSVNEMIELACSLRQVNVGLRPFESFHEFDKWLGLPMPRADEVLISSDSHGDSMSIHIEGRADSHPVWAHISNGRVMAVLEGVAAPREVLECFKIDVEGEEK